MTFKDLLKEKNFTIYRLSKLSGIAKTTLFDIASGKSDIFECKARVLYNIAITLGVTIEELLKLDREEYKSYFEENLPLFLDEALSNVKKSKQNKDFLYDCYLDELNSSINVAEVEMLITKEQAEYLRKKYL